MATIHLSEKQIARFWGKVQKGNGCWIWRGTVTRAGYGHVRVWPKNFKAHRVSWVLENGQIPDGMFVCHRCDNPLCVNPDHLFLGTPRDNHDDMKAKGRAPVGPKNGNHTHPESVARGERQGSAKLTEADVRVIRREWVFASTGQYNPKARELSERFGISAENARRIAKRQSWKHVTE